MRKVWECSLRWRLLRCLCLLLVSSILLLNTSIESNASTYKTETVRIHVTGNSKISTMYNVEGASSVYSGSKSQVINLNIADYFSDIFENGESYIIDSTGCSVSVFGGSMSDSGNWDYGSYKSSVFKSVVLNLSQTEFAYDGSVEPFSLNLDYDYQANCTTRTVGSSKLYCVQGYIAYNFYFDVTLKYQKVGSGSEDLPEENPDSTVQGWKDITSYSVTSNGVSLDAKGDASSPLPYGFGTLVASYSGLTDEYHSYIDNTEFIEFITYGENAYRIDIPLNINFSMEESITLDGELHYPIKFDLETASEFEGGDVQSMELELYDSMGNRINSEVDFDFYERDDTQAFYDVLLKLRFDKRFIDKNIYGFLRVYASYTWDLSAPDNSVIGWQVGHGSYSAYSDYHTLKYYEGNISNKELVTYQQAGHFEVSEDGSLTWIEGDTVTEYVGQEEEAKQQTEELKEQTETQKGIFQKISEFFGSFFQNLIDSIIHIFVPTKEEMSDLFNRLNEFFAETFGFLYYPFDFIIDAFNIFLEADSETGLTLPGFSIMGYEVWGNQTYDIASEPIVGTIFGYVRMGTGAMLAMWFVNYLRNFFDKRFGGGGN